MPLVLLAAILILLGLLPALYTSRRKVWVRAEPNGNGAVLKVGGFALQRKPQFDEEFSKLVDAMAARCGRRLRRVEREGTGELGDDRPAVGAASPTTRSTWRCSPTSPRWWATSRTWRSAANALWAIARTVAYVGLVANVVRSWPAGFAAAPGAVGQHVRVLGRCWRCWSSLGYLVIVEGYYKIRTLGGFALMFAVLTMAIAVSFLYVGPGPLVPALNSYWIKIHVRGRDLRVVAVRAGGASLTILYLVRTGASGGRWRRSARTEPPPIMGGVDRRGRARRTSRRDADEPDGRGRRRAAAACCRPRPTPRPDGVSRDRVRVPDLDVRGDRRRDLGAGGLGPLLGLGPEGDVVVRHVGDLRRATCTRARRRGGRDAAPRSSRWSGSSRC